MHSLARPVIYRWADLLQEDYTKATTSRAIYVLGGTHLTNPSFLPNALLKEMTATEYNANTSQGFFNKNHNLYNLDEQQEYIYSLANRPQRLSRTDPASSVEDVPTVLPWWLELAKIRAATLGRHIHPRTADQIKKKLFVDDGVLAAESRAE